MSQITMSIVPELTQEKLHWTDTILPECTDRIYREICTFVLILAHLVFSE